MKIHTAAFAVSAPNLALCPPARLPEFAFIGRSNVGKSSLINLLTGKKDLARVSDLPGKTKLINFFTINSAWTLVDLPGYGYAKVAKTDRQEFSTAVRTFLRERPSLVHTFVLIDSRHEPQEMDLKFVHWIGSSGRPFALVFTKIDKQSAQVSRNRIDQFRAAMAGTMDFRPPVFASSATTKAGRDDILSFITKSLPDKKTASDFTVAAMMTHQDRGPDTPRETSDWDTEPVDGEEESAG
ncbi:MAG: YihA family ribosome biogenesis GTP-binding protein [Opitutae bacterium]|nr:YihA family ribosome biogenesis GTP-binding protein [Opitutae bacterium]